MRLSSYWGVSAMIAGLSTLLFVASSCSDRYKSSKQAVTAELNCISADAPPPPPPPACISAPFRSSDNPDLKLIKTADITFKTKDSEKARQSLYEITRQYSGYVESEDFSNDYDDYKRYDIVLLIEADKFDTFFARFDSLQYKIIQRTIRVEDATLQYKDDSSMLVAKRKIEKKYLELLSIAKDVEDIIEIENKISEVQRDIEYTTSKIRYLEKQVAYSRINFTIKSENTYIESIQETSYGQKLLTGMKTGWNGFKSVIIALVTIWPLILIALANYYIFRVIRRRFREKKK